MSVYRNYPPRPPYRRVHRQPGQPQESPPPDDEKREPQAEAQPVEAQSAEPVKPSGVDDQVIDQFEKELIDARRQVDEANDRYLRARAELENVRKRAERQAEMRFDSQRRDLLLSLLPVVDNLELALAHAEPDSQLHGGVEATLRQFLRALEDNGVKRLDPTGETFDPAFHEAVEAAHSDRPSGTVIEVTRPGYTLNDSLVRPAQVRVAR